MGHKVIDCLINGRFGETAQQPTSMLKVRDTLRARCWRGWLLVAVRWVPVAV